MKKLVLIMLVLISGCMSKVNSKGKIVCYQDKDYIAFSTIVYDNQDPLISGNVDQYINITIDNLGKTEAGQTDIGFINEFYLWYSDLTLQQQWQWKHKHLGTGIE